MQQLTLTASDTSMQANALKRLCLGVLMIVALCASSVVAEETSRDGVQDSVAEKSVEDSGTAGQDETSVPKNKKFAALSGRLSYSVLELVRHGGQEYTNGLFGDPEDIDLQIQEAWYHILMGQVGVVISPTPSFSFSIGYRASIGGIEGAGLSEAAVRLDRPKLDVTAGIFRYRYNDDSRNLGEYLIHSGTYPGYVYSGREWDNVVGLGFSTSVVPVLNQDLLIISETNQIPFFDISIAYLFELPVADIVTLGGGVMFSRLLQPQPAISEWTSERGIDYNHRGIKAMLRFSWNIKELFGSPEIFGTEDLKLYSEGAILGTTDYPVYYEDLWERIPVMVGFTVPAFGLLDYCSAEFEWYGTPYYNYPPYQSNWPIPRSDPIGWEDDFKWSVSIKKSVGKYAAFYARVANDHFRFESPHGGVEHWEHLVARDHWYWSAKTEFFF